MVRNDGNAIAALIRDGDVLSGYRHDASGLTGDPDAVARPRETAELIEIVRGCLDSGLSITPCGGLSSTTGSPLAAGGVALDCRGLDGIVDLEPAADGRSAVATVRPGTNLAQLQAELTSEGWHYPPDPTSAPDCTIGGTVATNASGPNSFRFGSTRQWIAGVELIDGTGTVRRFQSPQVDKIAMGYRFVGQPLDLVVGSEGTLGVLTEIRLMLRPSPRRVIGLLIPCDGISSLLRVVDAARLLQACKPRCIEGFCPDAVAVAAELCPLDSTSAPAAVWVEVEVDGDEDPDAIVSTWLPVVELGKSVLDPLVVDSPTGFRKMAAWRHAIPATMNELGHQAAVNGGRKHSTDWCVPPRELDRVLDLVQSRLAAARLQHLRHICYGHFGNGHPHHNLISTNGEDAAALDQLLSNLVAAIQGLGGVLAAEHGIGKLKRKSLAQVLDPVILDAARRVKKAFDPRGLMAPGNLYDQQPATKARQRSL